MYLLRNRNLLLVVLVILLAVSFGVGNLHANEDIYYCPMHPQVVSDKPGSCPICHMRLVRRGSEAEHGSDHIMPSVAFDPAGELPASGLPAGYSSVVINPLKQQLIGIRTLPVQKKELKRSLLTSARVVYDPELYEAQIEYLREYRIAQGTLRNRELAFKNLVDSRWEAPRVEVARSKLILMGMEEESLRELIANAKADEALLYLKPDGDVWVYADVFESETPWLRPNDRVSIQSPSIPGKTYEGVVQGVADIVDLMTRRVRVRIRLKNDGLLKPEMFLNATIESSVGEGLAVPQEAVFLTGTEAIVFVDKGRGLFEPRAVDIGILAGADYQILRGLAEGERIVVDGNFLLDSESRLKASIEQAAALHAGHGGKNDHTA